MSPAKRTRRECSKHDDIPTIPVILALLVAPLVSFVTIMVTAVAFWLFLVVPLCLFGTVVFFLLGAVLFMTNLYLGESPEQQPRFGSTADKWARGLERKAKQMGEDDDDGEDEEEESDDDELWGTEGDEEDETEEEEELKEWGSQRREDLEEQGERRFQWQKYLKESHEQVVVAWNSLKASLGELRAEMMAELRNL